MIFKKFTLGKLETNCYIIADEANNEAAIIDAPPNIKEVIDYIKQKRLEVKYVLVTHHHYDHTYSLSALRKAFPNAEVTNRSVKIGEIDIKSISTPGHAIDSVSFHIPKELALFSGDTLFKGTIGRTDQRDSDFEEERKSIREELYVLPPKTKVYPGHGEDTTIEAEKAHNPDVLPHWVREV